MHRLIFTLLSVLVLSACSKYERLLKSSDMELKYTKALEYYEDEKYYKAYPLIEECYAFYRGSSRAEHLYYIYAYSDYYLGDLLLAAHRFNQFDPSALFPRVFVASWLIGPAGTMFPSCWYCTGNLPPVTSHA